MAERGAKAAVRSVEVWEATAAVVANPEAPAEPEVRTNVFHPSLGFNTLLSIPSRLSTDR